MEIRYLKLIGLTENSNQIASCWISTKECSIPKRWVSRRELPGNVWRTSHVSGKTLRLTELRWGIHTPYRHPFEVGFSRPALDFGRKLRTQYVGMFRFRVRHWGMFSRILAPLNWKSMTSQICIARFRSWLSLNVNINSLVLSTRSNRIGFRRHRLERE